jgi:hypothetical protein
MTATPRTATSSRNDTVTTCGQCGTPFTPTGRQAWCSPACRVAAWRRRNASVIPEPAIPPKGHRRAVTVYECDTCGERALGDQYCVECRTFMRRLGVGGCCPSCDAPLAVTELIGPAMS